jgi:hypothetical protein
VLRRRHDRGRVDALVGNGRATVTLPALRGATQTYQNTLGEFETRLFLFQHLKDQNNAVQGAAGWDGDRYVLFDTPRGQGIAWATVWDSQADASEFFDLLGKIAAKRYNAPADSTAGALVRNYSGGGRTVQTSTAEINGRPVVLYVDVPAGSPTDVIDLAAITLKQ